MHIGILQTGRARQSLLERHGSFAGMFERWLAERRPGLAFSAFDVHEDGFPARVDTCDAWLITGSPQGVYERDPWMLRLEGFVRDAAAAGVPQVGICFGHQILASAFGGEVVQSERGWGMGTHVVEVIERRSWMVPGNVALALHVSHQDQVVETPACARLVATSDFCPASALVYPEQRALSFQGHPEHSRAFASDLIELRRTQGMDERAAERARASLETPTDEDVVAEWVLRFIEEVRARDGSPR